MADYFSFVDGVPISVLALSDSDEDFNMEGVNLDEEEPEVRFDEPEVRFDDPNVASDDLAVALSSNPEVTRKRPRDDDNA